MWIWFRFYESSGLKSLQDLKRFWKSVCSTPAVLRVTLYVISGVSWKWTHRHTRDNCQASPGCEFSCTRRGGISESIPCHIQHKHMACNPHADPDGLTVKLCWWNICYTCCICKVWCQCFVRMLLQQLLDFEALVTSFALQWNPFQMWPLWLCWNLKGNRYFAYRRKTWINERHMQSMHCIVLQCNSSNNALLQWSLWHYIQ